MNSKKMKEKENSVRTFDDDGFKRRAACLVFKDITEQEVLLVTCNKGSHHWVVPGGGVEPTEDYLSAAAREVEEEAGVRGTIGRCLGRFENKERRTRTSVFVMVATKLLEDWEDLHKVGRQRRWFSIEDAKSELSQYKPTQRHYLELLNSSKQQSHDTSVT